MKKKTDKQVLKIILDIISRDYSSTQVLEKLGGKDGLSAFNWKAKNVIVSDYANPKSHLSSFFETLDNHEDAIGQYNTKNCDTDIQINSRFDLLKLNSKLAGKELSSTRWENGTKNPKGKSPYLNWKGKRVDVIFGNVDIKSQKRNIITMDSGIGMTPESYEDKIIDSVGNSDKQNQPWSTGTLGLGESAPLKHCSFRAIATRSRGHDMVLGLNFILEDLDLLNDLVRWNGQNFPILNLVNEMGEPFTCTEEDLRKHFSKNHIPFKSSEFFETKSTKAPSYFEYGFLNKLIGYNLSDVTGFSQIAKHPENNLNQIINTHYEYLTCPIVLTEANPTTRQNKGKGGTAKSVHAKGFNFKYDNLGGDMTSHEIFAKFSGNNVNKPSIFKVNVESKYKKSTEKMKANIYIVIKGKMIIHTKTPLKLFNSINKHTASKAEKEVLSRMIVRLDLSNVSTAHVSRLLTGDKSQIDTNHNEVLKDLGEQMEVIFSCEKFKTEVKKAEENLKSRQTNDKTFEQFQNQYLKFLNPCSSNIKRVSDTTKISRENDGGQLVTLFDKPSYLDLPKQKIKVSENQKVKFLHFKTDAKRSCFFDGKGSLDTNNFSISHKNVELFKSIGYEHGILDVSIETSKLPQSLNEGEEAEISYNFSVAGLVFSGTFKVQVVKSKTNTSVGSSGTHNPKQHIHGVGSRNEAFPSLQKPNFEFISEKEYVRELSSTLEDESFKKALSEQYSINDSEYIKNNMFYFLTKNGDKYDVLINKDGLQSFIYEGKLCDDHLKGCIVKTALRVCNHKEVLLSDNIDIMSYISDLNNKNIVNK